MAPAPLPAHLTIAHKRIVASAPKLFTLDGNEALMFLTPILGPTSTLVLHRCASWLTYENRIRIGTEDFAGHFGVSVSQLASSVRRLQAFGFVDEYGDEFHVASAIYHFPVRWLERMPTQLQLQLMDWQRVVAGASA